MVDHNLNIIAITQARVSSTRFPAKILQQVAGEPLLKIHLDRIKQAKNLTKIIVATTTEPGVSAILDIASDVGVETYQGSLDNVLDRFYQAAKLHDADYVVRLTSDCPLIDHKLIDRAVEAIIESRIDYVSNTLIQHFPDGQDVEVMTFAALQKAWEEANLPSEREHVTPFIWKNSDFKEGMLFKVKNMGSDKNYNPVRMTVDEPLDLEAIKILVAELGVQAPWEDYTNFIINNPGLFVNQKIGRNEGYSKAISND